MNTRSSTRGRSVDSRRSIKAYPIDRVLIGYAYPMHRASSGYDVRCVKCGLMITQ